MTCKNNKLTLENSVLTCVHVLKKQASYEYIAEDKKLNACESFTCSNCLDLNEVDQVEAQKNMRVVCRECFIKNRVKKNV